MADGFDVGAARQWMRDARSAPAANADAAFDKLAEALDALGLATEQRVLTKDEQRLVDVICDSGMLGVGSTHRLRALITRLTGPAVKE